MPPPPKGWPMLPMRPMLPMLPPEPPPRSLLGDVENWWNNRQAQQEADRKARYEKAALDYRRDMQAGADQGGAQFRRMWTEEGQALADAAIAGFGTRDLGVGGAMVGSIKAYHGSPHLFDKFSLKEIGKGEGQQAYGHGLYFAETPAVAETYNPSAFRDAGKNRLPPVQQAIDDALGRANGDIGKAKENLQKIIAIQERNITNFDVKQKGVNALDIAKGRLGYTKEALAEFEAGRIAAEKSPGALYEVELSPDRHELLDWDKDFNAQSEAVRTALNKVEYKGKPHQFPEERSGQALYNDIGLIAMQRPEYAGMNMHEAASAYLKKLGVPGLKYLDQQSRGAGEGSRNLVMFGDEGVKILKRNGEPMLPPEPSAPAPQAMLPDAPPPPPPPPPPPSSTGNYPRVGKLVDGREVMDEIPNQSSIAASLSDYEVMPGIRELPLSDFGGPSSFFYAADDFKRAEALAEQIAQSNKIAPMIVVIDAEGPYILEGAHRMVALQKLGAKTFPAKVVMDRESLAAAAKEKGQ